MTGLVTGGAGFIGEHLAERLLESGHNNIVLDAMRPYYDLRIEEYTIGVHRETADRNKCEYEFVEEDVRDNQPVDNLVADCDYEPVMETIS